jgi:hypothetical protein
MEFKGKRRNDRNMQRGKQRNKYTKVCGGNEERHEGTREDFAAVGSRRPPVHILYR